MQKIVKMTPFHCQRGSRGCEKCRKLAEKGEKYCLIEIYDREGMIARPMIEVEINGDKVFCEFDLLMIFEDHSEAKDYALKNGIMIIESRQS